MITRKERQIALDCKSWAEDKKADNPVILDLSELGGPACLFLICSGSSTPQLRAIMESIEEGMSTRYGLRPYGRDGGRSSEWRVLDYGLILVHVLSPAQRNYYQLEELWQDAKVIRG